MAIPKATVEPYVLFRQSEGLAVETGGLGDIQQTTIGTRVAGKISRDFDYGVEMAAQTGSVSTDDVRAWAGHWLIGKTFTTASGKPRPFVEFNYASGDTDPKDGVRGTFDQLYPTGHDKLGLADQVGWRNIHHLRGGLEVKPKAQWQLSGSYHTFWLASATDALYGANGVAIARSIAGTAGRYVGQELDAQAVYTYSSQLQIAGGYAHVLPGEFLKNTTPGRVLGLSYAWSPTYSRATSLPPPPRRTVRRTYQAAGGSADGLMLGTGGGRVRHMRTTPRRPGRCGSASSLTDCSSIVMAHELGSSKVRDRSVISKEASWAVILTSCRSAQTRRRICFSACRSRRLWVWRVHP
jgi:hypothetical protein